jgi:CheY-like chemotaxis protein
MASKKKILIVDDDPTSLRTVEGLLTLHGYETAVSNNAQDIASVVTAFYPDVIVMDLLMPKVDGTQAVRILQDHPNLKTIPVIFLTALKTHDEERGFELDISVQNKSFRTLNKPLDANALINEIRKLAGQV